MLLVRFLDLLQDLSEIVGFRRLQRRIRHVGLQLFEPQQLAERHHGKSVVHEGGARGGQLPAKIQQRLRVVGRNVLLERVTLDVLDQGEVPVDQRTEPAGRSGPRYFVVYLPVVVADRRWRRSRVVEEVVARRFLRLAGQVVNLVDAIERGLDDTGILAGLDLLLQSVTFRTAGDLDEGWQPVEGREQLVLQRAGPDDAGPADHRWGAEAALPGFAFLAFEGRDATIREGYRLGAVVSGEHDNGVVGLCHVVDLLEHVADVVVHLLHADFVDTPVLAAHLAQHGQILVRQHGRDVHAGRVVPDEEWLAGLPGVVAVKEVDNLGGDFLIHGLGAVECRRPSIAARLVLLCAIGGFAPDDRARRGHTDRGFRVHGAGDLGQTGDGRVLAGWSKALGRWVLVDVGEAHRLHGVEVVEVAPELLETVRGRQGRGVIAQVVLAELAGIVAKVDQKLGECGSAGL